MENKSEILLLNEDQEMQTARVTSDEDLEHTRAGQGEQITLKCDDAFLVSAISGDFSATRPEMGLYWHGTRFLRTCNLLLEGRPLVVLSYDITDQGDACQIDLTNNIFTLGNDCIVEQGMIHIHRQVRLCHNQLVQTFTITSFHTVVMPLTLSLKVGNDFCDMFEVRGLIRTQRGKVLAPHVNNAALMLRYFGTDDITRESAFAFTPPADAVLQDRLFWNLQLTRSQPVQIDVTMQMREIQGRQSDRQLIPTRARPALPPSPDTFHIATVQTDDPLFNRLLSRGIHDLTMLSTKTPYGRYPYAGIPWFSCPFGRDALVACLEFLPWMPDVVRGTLSFLAAHQGTKFEAFTDEEPGKILHEYRTGEMANRREIPYIPYYGSVDATPLFLIVLESYIRWTNDLHFLQHLWPYAQAAARWLVNYGDRDGDSFIEYHKASRLGLVNQGWKDAWDSISYSNGRIATSPLALCEVQAYAFAAYRAMSYLSKCLHKQYKEQYWAQTAETLRQNFLRAFWWEEEHTLYLALDGAKKPCDVVTTNAGQCLWTGIVPEDNAKQILQRLMREDIYSGWGLRTLSTQALRYNPLSYHNGSIWPHDNALVGAGFAQYDGKTATGILLKNMYEASLYYEQMRLPELFCGITRRSGYGPTRYPTACSPQAWAAGAPFLLLSSLLGLRPDASRRRLTLEHPRLPDWLTQVEIQNMRIRTCNVHIRILRVGTETKVVQEPDNEVEIQVLY